MFSCVAGASTAQAQARDWAGWENIGGSFAPVDATHAAAPTCISTNESPPRVHCFSRNASNGLLQQWWTSTRWRSAEIGGDLAGRPSCVATNEVPVRIHCFSRSRTGSLQQQWWNGSRWASADLGGRLAGDPSCVATKESPVRIHCFSRTAARTLQQQWWTGSSWRATDLGGLHTTDPACLATDESPVRIHCFSKSSSGTLQHRWSTGSTWHGEDLGGAPASTPSCVATKESPVRIHCFSRSPTATLQQQWWNGSRWASADLGGQLVSNPSCLATEETPVRIHCFSRGVDAAVRHQWWNGSAWRTESLGAELGGTAAELANQAPACVTTPGAEPKLFALARDDENENSYWTWPGNSATLADFGYDTMRFGRSGNQVNMNVLLVLVSYADSVFNPDQTAEFYEQKYFGAGGGLQEFFQANAPNLDVRATRVDTLQLTHPMTLACAHRWERCATRDTEPYEQNFVELLEAAPPTEVSSLERYDSNGDGSITPDELFVLFVLALPPRGPENPYGDNGGLKRRFPRCASLAGTSKRICGDMLPLGDRTNFITGAHEVAHLFGTADIYGEGNNGYYSLMAGTEGSTEFFVHLDPWHKMRMGAATPRIVAIQQRQPSWSEVSTTSQPITIFYDPLRGKNEYFVVESRSRATPFDEDVASEGIVVWYVNTDDRFVPKSINSLPAFSSAVDGAAVVVVGAPDYSLGRGQAWQSGDELEQLMWSDASFSRLRMRVTSDTTYQWWSEDRLP